MRIHYSICIFFFFKKKKGYAGLASFTNKPKNELIYCSLINDYRDKPGGSIVIVICLSVTHAITSGNQLSRLTNFFR